jgi:hypothetical protein
VIAGWGRSCWGLGRTLLGSVRTSGGSLRSFGPGSQCSCLQAAVLINRDDTERKRRVKTKANPTQISGPAKPTTNDKRLTSGIDVAGLAKRVTKIERMFPNDVPDRDAANTDGDRGMIWFAREKRSAVAAGSAADPDAADAVERVLMKARSDDGKIEVAVAQQDTGPMRATENPIK